MLQFLFRRTLQLIATLFAVATIIFFALRVLPGDPVEFKYTHDTGGRVDAAVLERERARFGYDKPLHEQYLNWIGGLARMDLGVSLWSEQPVSKEIAGRFGNTLSVAIAALVVGVLIALPLGIGSALARGTWIDQVIRVLTVTGLSVPSFWLGMIVLLSLLSVFGWIPSIEQASFKEKPGEWLAQIFFPALVVGWRLSSMNARMLRSSLLEVLGEDYIRTARSKGVSPRRVMWRHALSNALLPTVAVLGLEFAGLLGGLVVTEQVFNINGIGRLLIQAVSLSDLALIQGLVMLFALIYVVANFAVDVLNGVLDPRIRAR
jgi:peptide/nickel transport system permease protein